MSKHGKMGFGFATSSPTMPSAPPGEAKCLFWGPGDHRNQPLINIGKYNVLWILSDKQNSNIHMCWGKLQFVPFIIEDKLINLIQ